MHLKENPSIFSCLLVSTPRSLELLLILNNLTVKQIITSINWHRFKAPPPFLQVLLTGLSILPSRFRTVNYVYSLNRSVERPGCIFSKFSPRATIATVALLSQRCTRLTDSAKPKLQAKTVNSITGFHCLRSASTNGVSGNGRPRQEVPRSVHEVISQMKPELRSHQQS